MPAHSSISQPSLSKPPIVVVAADDKRLNFSIPPDQNLEAFDEDGAQKLKRTKLMAIWNTTTINFEFDGTGIAVAGLTRDSFPLIPTNLLPSFGCTIDGQPADPPDSRTSDIPVDGKNIICRKKGLQADQHHILSVQVTVSSIPAFIDSIRYRPLPNDVSDGKITLNNTFLRIDSQDTKYIQFDKQGWGYTHRGRQVHLTSKPDRPPPERFMNIAIPSNRMQQLKWFGDLVSTGHDRDRHHHSIFPSSRSLPVPVVLDGVPVPIEMPTHAGWDESKELFSYRLNNSMISSSSHVLSISAPEGYKLSLDHLLVTLGGSNSNDTQSDSNKMRGHSVSSVIPIISGIVGSLFIISVTLFTVKWIQKRRRRRHTWRDSALPSAIQHPATIVSSRSSFSREVVTGDIEYNPEAQKKLDGALNAGVTDPPQALVLHADSGYRVRNASEVPPRYTRL